MGMHSKKKKKKKEKNSQKNLSHLFSSELKYPAGYLKHQEKVCEVLWEKHVEYRDRVSQIF